MRKKRWILAAAAVSMAVFLCAGCAAKEQKEEPAGKKTAGGNTTENDATVTGMYLTFGVENESYIFADVEQETLFHAEIPEGNLMDENGEKIDAGDLKAGDIIDIYGSGAVAESFPPIYIGITKMERTKAGEAGDAEKYAHLIAEIYQEPDPSEIPYLDIENRQEMAIVTSVINHGGYSWSYEEDGQMKGVEADSPHVLEWKRSDAELVELTCDTDDKDLKLMFSRSPKSVTVTRWESTATIADAENGEDVEITMNKMEGILKDAIPGSVYQVVAVWENGTVTYGFAVK